MKDELIIRELHDISVGCIGWLTEARHNNSFNRYLPRDATLLELGYATVCRLSARL